MSEENLENRQKIDESKEQVKIEDRIDEAHGNRRRFVEKRQLNKKLDGGEQNGRKGRRLFMLEKGCIFYFDLDSLIFTINREHFFFFIISSNMNPTDWVFSALSL